MTPFANASTPVRAAFFAALVVGASALFLFVASNVLLLGLHVHDGGFHLIEIVSSWAHYGADKRLDRWLTLSTLAGLVVCLRRARRDFPPRPLPLHGKARFASARDIAAGGPACAARPAARTQGRLSPLLRGLGACSRLRPDPHRQGRRLCHSQSSQLVGFGRRPRRKKGELG